jgi:peptidoglycan hydrolase-like protein with peptidoglycan-binding domain
MKLQDRNLSIGMQGADVELLQEELRALDFDIPQAEMRESSFREGTQQAVKLFQERLGLERTGVADRRTAELINKESDRRTKKFIVRGQVLRGDRRPLRAVSVRMCDRDLRSQEELGETRTDAEGRFELSYFADKFTRAEKGSADLLFELSWGLGKFELLRRKDKEMVVVPAPQIIFNAGDEEQVELILREEDIPSPSEYERLVEELTPLLETLSPIELRRR